MNYPILMSLSQAVKYSGLSKAKLLQHIEQGSLCAIQQLVNSTKGKSYHYKIHRQNIDLFLDNLNKGLVAGFVLTNPNITAIDSDTQEVADDMEYVKYSADARKLKKLIKTKSKVA